MLIQLEITEPQTFLKTVTTIRKRSTMNQMSSDMGSVLDIKLMLVSLMIFCCHQLQVYSDTKKC